MASPSPDLASNQPEQSAPLQRIVVPLDRRMGNNRGLTQAYQLRDLAANTAFALRDELIQPDGSLIIRRDEYGKPVDAPAIAQLIRAWSEAREAIRILKGRPLPGSLRPERKPAKPKRKSPMVVTKVADSPVREAPAPTPTDQPAPGK